MSSPSLAVNPARVVVTGIGIVTAFGRGTQKNSEGFRQGTVALRPLTLFDVSRQRVKSGGQFIDSLDLPATRLTARVEGRLDRAARLLVCAGHEAWTAAGAPALGATPVVLGSSSGGMARGEKYYDTAVDPQASQRRQPSRLTHYQAQRPGIELNQALGGSGPVTIIANACASGANALGHAWQLVRQRRTERVLAGGYDALCHMVFAGFDALQALSPTVCRPFDRHRDGLALGEGAAVLILESLELAAKRNVRIWGEIVGYGSTNDLHHLTQPQPEGAAALTAMHAACAAAGVPASAVQYVNAHGTGTALNDSAEAAAINRWAGEHAPQLTVSSTKASIGHLLGAAGAVETAACLMALEGQWLPPTSTTEAVDPACAFPLVRRPAQHQLEFALTNSFGFGGANASLLLRRWKE